MKLKTFYILAAICCMGLISSAKQSGKKCDGICRTQLKGPKQTVQKVKEKPAYEISSLTFFIHF